MYVAVDNLANKECNISHTIYAKSYSKTIDDGGLDPVYTVNGHKFVDGSSNDSDSVQNAEITVNKVIGKKPKYQAKLTEYTLDQVKLRHKLKDYGVFPIWVSLIKPKTTELEIYK